MGDTAQFLGGAWCLDFANTVEPRTSEGRDYLPDFAALISWSARAGVLNGQAGADIQRAATPADAQKAFERAIRLREATYRIFRAIATDEPPPAPDLRLVRDEHADAVRHAVPSWSGMLRWEWRGADPNVPGWWLVDDAVRLLQSPQLERVKMCRPSCGWLFLDLTRNGSRRWCSTEDCGVREKIRRQAERRAARRQGREDLRAPGHS